MKTIREECEKTIENKNKSDANEAYNLSTQEFINDARERRNLKTQGKSNIMECDQCEYKTSSTTFLNKHKETVHEGLHEQKCDQCEYKTSSTTLLNKHKESVHEGLHQQQTQEMRTRIKCDQCEFKTTSTIVLKTHTNIQHKGKVAATNKRQICDICKKNSIKLPPTTSMCKKNIRKVKGNCQIEIFKTTRYTDYQK